MLSIENPSKTSCFSKISELREGGRAARKGVTFQGDTDPIGRACLDENQLPQFSIRDYVFTERAKNISLNWPFSQPLLQLCLEHGVKDPLPPFQSSNLVRGQCYQVGERLVVLNSCIESEKVPKKVDSFDKNDEVLLNLEGDLYKNSSVPLDQTSLEFFDVKDEKSCRQLKSSVLNEAGCDGLISSPKDSHAIKRVTPLLNETNNLSEAAIEFETLQPGNLSNKTENFIVPFDKKYKLIVKFGGEDISSNSSSLSEPMASKVCPVCKSFASTSNTTLNAHIDQCLAVESTFGLALTDIIKNRVKPRKKRLISDIYITAPHCTLEDLERRNGRNLANDSNWMHDHKIHIDRKRQRISQLDTIDSADEDHVVYVDSNGIKLRILSKFNNTSAASLGNDLVEKSQLDAMTEGKKNHLVSRCSKQLKDEPQIKNAYDDRLHKDNEVEASEADEECNMFSREKERSLSQLLKDQGPIKFGGPVNLRQWACSKRSCLSKKSRDGRRWCAGKQSQAKSNLSDLGNHPKRNTAHKFSRKGPALSLRPQRINTPNSKDDERTSVRLPESDPNSERVSLSDLYVARKSLARMKDLPLKKSFPLRSGRNAENRRNLRPRMARHATDMNEQARRKTSDEVEDYYLKCDSTEKLRLSSVNCNIRTTRKLNHLVNVPHPEIAAGINEEYQGRNKTLKSDSESGDTNTSSDHEETVISQGLHSTSEFCCQDLEFSYSKGDGSLHQNMESVGQESSLEELNEKTLGFNIESSSETQNADGNEPSLFYEVVSPGPTYQQHPVLQVPLPDAPRKYVDHDINCYNKESNKVEAIKEVNAGSFTATDPMVNQILGEVLCSPRDLCIDVQENSSVTSSEPYFNRKHRQQVDVDHSGSPVSANSVISYPLGPTSTCGQLLQQTSFVGPFCVQERVSKSISDSNGEAILPNDVDLPINSSLTYSPNGWGIERAVENGSIKDMIGKDTNQEMQALKKNAPFPKMMTPPKEGRQVTTSIPNVHPQSCASFVPYLDSSSVDFIAARRSLNAATEAQNHPRLGLNSTSLQSLPSPSSTCCPILRLMGKDLKIVSKDEGKSIIHQKAPLATPNDHPINENYLNLLHLPNGNVSNLDGFSFHSRFSGDSLFDMDYPCYARKNLDIGCSGEIRSLNDCNELHPALPAKSAVNPWENGPMFVASTMGELSKDGASMQYQNQILDRMSNVRAANTMKEVFAINGAPEKGDPKPVDANYEVVSGRKLAFLDDRLSLPAPATNLHSRSMDDSCFSMPSAFSEASVVPLPRSSFLMPFPCTNGSPSKAGNAVEGLGILPLPSSSTLASPSLGHLNPPLFYSSLQ